MPVFGHVLGLPVEEALGAAPGAIAALGVAAALLRARVAGARDRRRA